MPESYWVSPLTGRCKWHRSSSQPGFAWIGPWQAPGPASLICFRNRAVSFHHDLSFQDTCNVSKFSTPGTAISLSISSKYRNMVSERMHLASVSLFSPKAVIPLPFSKSPFFPPQLSLTLSLIFLNTGYKLLLKYFGSDMAWN